MTALAEQLTALGYFNTTAIADSAITAAQVYKDDNGQIRVAGSSTVIQADIRSNSQIAGLTNRYSNPGIRGTGTNIY